MAKNNNPEKSDELSACIIKGIQEKKGENIVVLDLQTVDGAVTDFFVICEGNSNTQVDAIKDSIEEEVRKALGEKPWHIEGTSNLEWVLLDYVNVVAHVFQKDKRAHYNLEGLWADADTKQIEAIN